MNTEQIKYEDYSLDPDKDVLVPMQDYVALNNIIQAVEREHSKVVQTDKFAFFHRKTNKKLSNKSKVKMSPDKLAKDYYENIDLEETKKTRRVERDELGAASLELLGIFRGIYRHNIDQGNRVLREDKSSIEPVAEPAVNES